MEKNQKQGKVIKIITAAVVFAYLGLYWQNADENVKIKVTKVQKGKPDSTFVATVHGDTTQLGDSLKLSEKNIIVPYSDTSVRSNILFVRHR